MTIARELAERICAMDHANHPAEAVYWSRIAVMDRFGIDVGMVSTTDERLHKALERYPDRIIASMPADGNRGWVVLRCSRLFSILRLISSEESFLSFKVAPQTTKIGSVLKILER